MGTGYKKTKSFYARENIINEECYCPATTGDYAHNIRLLWGQRKKMKKSDWDIFARLILSFPPGIGGKIEKSSPKKSKKLNCIENS